MIVTFDRNPHLTEDQKIESLARSVQLALNEKADKDTASQTFVDKDTAAQYVIKSALLDMVYPVGSYYETSDASFDPNTDWGGTWDSEIVTDDEVIEEVNSPNGTTSGWSYRKWKSGISECWGRTVETTYVMTNAYGNGYYAQKNPIATFPSIFISPPIVNITRTNVSTGGGLIFASIYATTATTCSAYVFDSRSESMSLQFSMYARGFWKTYTAPTNTYRWHRTA